MELALDDGQEAFRAMLRRAFRDALPSERLRGALQGDAELWAFTGAQLGLHGLAVSEAEGGSGASAVEQVLLHEEAGRVLLPGPFFATTALAGSLLVAAGVRTDELAAGTLRAAFAWGTGDLANGRLSGTSAAVLDAEAADLLLAVAGDAVVAVDRRDIGVVTVPLTTLDLTRPAADVRFDEAEAMVLSGAHVVPNAMQRMRLCLAAEQVGGAQRCLELAVDYAKVREQFGRPIGSFQAVKHKLADMLVRVELARSLAWYAAWHLDDETWTAAASALCSETYLRVATDAIQVHGGIGFTWEHDLHLHYRRAKADHAMLGTPRAHRARIAQAIA